MSSNTCPHRFFAKSQSVRLLEDSDHPVADGFDWLVVAEYDTLLPRIAKQEVILVPTLEHGWGRALSLNVGHKQSPMPGLPANTGRAPRLRSTVARRSAELPCLGFANITEALRHLWQAANFSRSPVPC
jgi:hypothetical protein